MEWWESIVLGIVQGASEFLPISSSGHLLLFEKFGIGEENLFFNILLHIGTLLAVLIVMRKEWWTLVRHPFQKKTALLIVACIPTVALAFVFKYCFPELLKGEFLALGFMATACILFASEKLNNAKPQLNTVGRSVLTGISQGLAVLPGISRSGATIATMRLLGIEKEEAASFSFLLSIPIILGSALFEGLSLIKNGGVETTARSASSVMSISLGNVELLPIILGVVCAFLSGLLAIKVFLKLIKSKSLLGFALYDAVLALVTLATIR